jgi:hypothetical protein
LPSCCALGDGELFQVGYIRISHVENADDTIDLMENITLSGRGGIGCREIVVQKMNGLGMKR